jgi:hypothetical protein
MTLDSNIVNKQFFNPQISRVKNLSLSADGAIGESISKPPIEGITRLKVTKPFIYINAQKKPTEMEVGSILWGRPTSDEKVFIFETEGKKYNLILGENAEIFTKSKEAPIDNENKKGGVFMILGVALGAYIIYNLLKK